jgi:hypothetical protein
VGTGAKAQRNKKLWKLNLSPISNILRKSFIILESANIIDSLNFSLLMPRDYFSPHCRKDFDLEKKPSVFSIKAFFDLYTLFRIIKP